MSDVDLDLDLDLVRRARDGDLDAFERLVERHQTGLVRFLTHMVGHTADAEDLAQDSLLRAYRALKTFRGQSAFRTWLYQIGANLARTHRDKRRRRPEAPGADEPPAEWASEENVERRIVAHDLLRQALAALPGEWREAVVLRDIEGLDYKEIAEALDIPMGTVESRIFRGRQRLRELVTAGGRPHGGGSDS
jgi:RNA polymerase sigma-70 factor (ECF subfamily)